MGFLRQLNRHPSKGCKQRLTTAELIERTQQRRMQKMEKRKLSAIAEATSAMTFFDEDEKA